MTTLNLFSDADVATIKEMVRWFSTHRNTPFSEEADETGHQAPETYIAMVPSEGIAPLLGPNSAATGGDEPGSNECQFYDINSAGELYAITGLTRTVYNLSLSGTPPGWTLVTRSKHGRWIVLNQPAFLVGKSESAVTEGNFGTFDIYNYVTSPITSSLGLVPNGQTVSALCLLGSVTGGSFWVIIVPIGFGYIALNIACLASTGTST